MVTDPKTFLDGVGKALKTVPDLYNDGLKPSVQETGKLLARIPKAINAALSPLDNWMANKEYDAELTKKLLGKKLENVNPEEIVSPASYVAIPALQALSYSMDSDELRNMYANLLAKSMNINEKDKVHPCFVEIIKQMSPTDVKVFKSMVESPINPIINIQIKTDGIMGANTIIRHITGMVIAPINEISISLDNLQKSGLLYISDDMSYTNVGFYDLVKRSLYYLFARDSYHPAQNQKMIDQYGHIEITDLGKAFYDVCIKNF